MDNISKIPKILNRHPENQTFKNNFRFTEVVGSLEIQEVSKPFKKLKFENTEEIKFEKNQFKDIEISDVVSEFSFSFEEPKEKELVKNIKINTSEGKNKYFDAKSSPRSKRSEKFSTIYTLSSDSSKLPEEILDHEKPGSTKISQQNDEREKENIPSRSKEYLDFLPAKKFCKNCKCEVNTTVKMEMPTMPL